MRCRELAILRLHEEMLLNLKKPIIYLITSGETTPQTTPASEGFLQLLKLVEAAVAAEINLIQLREKNLRTRVLYELALRGAEITRGTQTHLLVNDRADVAQAAGAAGVHLTTRSVGASIIRRTYGDQFVIGVSTHSLAEARAAEVFADFAVFGPVFETASKRLYGEPVGLEKLSEVTSDLAPFPVLALGGITLDKITACFHAGASGIAAIRLMNAPNNLVGLVDEIRTRFGKQSE